jgi:hypothetical protein
MGLVGDYLVKVGHQTALEMKLALGLRLLVKYQARFPDATAHFLAASVTNRVFSEQSEQIEAQSFAQHNSELIEKEVRLIGADNKLSELVTSSIYNLCYARYVETGGKRGFFANNFLAYIRALSRSVEDSSYIDLATEVAAKLDRTVVEPIWTLLELGIFRPLPRNPDSKEIYSRVHAFAVGEGVRFA